MRKLSFTGSTAVGKVLMRDGASTVKKLSLELGGNAPVLVFDDADLETAVNGVMAGACVRAEMPASRCVASRAMSREKTTRRDETAPHDTTNQPTHTYFFTPTPITPAHTKTTHPTAKFRNAGQTCVSPNRLLVQAGIHDKFVARLAERVSELQVGHGLQPGVQQVRYDAGAGGGRRGACLRVCMYAACCFFAFQSRLASGTIPSPAFLLARRSFLFDVYAPSFIQSIHSSLPPHSTRAP